MIAHTYDMLLKRPPHTHSLTFHGEEIGVTTLTMARMQEALIRKPLTLYPLDFPKDAMPTLFGKSIAVEAAHTYKSKLERITEARPDYRFRDNAREWEAIIERIEPVMVPSAHIQAVLEAADCPQALQMLGWDTKAYETAIIYARFLRDRFTFLDIQS
jgi:glycerol-1-phosphate dehydrogenase [NAD(P)+]